MNVKSIFGMLVLATLTACDDGAKVGEECSADADCADGLECEMHEGETDHGECTEHDHDDHDDHDGE